MNLFELASEIARYTNKECWFDLANENETDCLVHLSYLYEQFEEELKMQKIINRIKHG